MRAVLQRVLGARVEVEGQIVSSIGPGILVLVGILDTDTEADAEFMCRKILNTRLFHNEKTGKGWDHSVVQKNFEVLMVSQFTLYGQLKGNKLDFHVAMPPDRAKAFYDSFVRRVATAYRPDAVKDGKFGAMMQIHLINDGPVTIQLDSQKSGSSARDTDQSYSPIMRANSDHKGTRRRCTKCCSGIGYIRRYDSHKIAVSGRRDLGSSHALKAGTVKIHSHAGSPGVFCFALDNRSHGRDCFHHNFSYLPAIGFT